MVCSWSQFSVLLLKQPWVFVLLLYFVSLPTEEANRSRTRCIRTGFPRYRSVVVWLSQRTMLGKMGSWYKTGVCCCWTRITWRCSTGIPLWKSCKGSQGVCSVEKTLECTPVVKWATVKAGMQECRNAEWNAERSNVVSHRKLWCRKSWSTVASQQLLRVIITQPSSVGPAAYPNLGSTLAFFTWMKSTSRSLSELDQ